MSARGVLLSLWLFTATPRYNRAEFDALSASHLNYFFSVFFHTPPCKCCHRFTVCFIFCSTILFFFLWSSSINLLSDYYFLDFTATLCSFYHLQHSSVGPSWFGLHFKEHDAEVWVCPAKANRTQFFFVLTPLICVFQQTKSFFLPTLVWTQRSTLMLWTLKGFIHIFSLLLFESFSLKLMFTDLYHTILLSDLPEVKLSVLVYFGVTWTPHCHPIEILVVLVGLRSPTWCSFCTCCS